MRGLGLPASRNALSIAGVVVVPLLARSLPPTDHPSSKTAFFLNLFESQTPPQKPGTELEHHMSDPPAPKRAPKAGRENSTKRIAPSGGAGVLGALPGRRKLLESDRTFLEMGAARAFSRLDPPNKNKR